jgi:hypothetical protein
MNFRETSVEAAKLLAGAVQIEGKSLKVLWPDRSVSPLFRFICSKIFDKPVLFGNFGRE